MLAGSPPRAMTTGMRSPRAAISRQCAAPTLCRCQCMASVFAPEHLHPVHADIADPACRVGGDHHRQGDVPPAVAGPGGEERDLLEIDRVVAQDHLLTGRPSALHPGRELADLRQLGQHRQLAEESLGHLEIEHLRDAARRSASRSSTPSARHIRRSEPNRLMATGCALRRPSSSSTCSNRSAGPPPGLFMHAVGDLRDLQAGAHRMADAHQLADAVDGLDELAEVVECMAPIRPLSLVHFPSSCAY